MQDLNDKVTGGTLTAIEWNELPSEVQNVIEALGITLSIGDLNQLGKAIAGYVANGTFYTDSGVADAYVLSVIGSKQGSTAYTDGFEAEFVVGNTNTGASTVDVAGLGVVDIAGTSSPGTLTVGDIVRMRHNIGTGDFDIVNNTAQAIPTFTSTEQTITDGGSLTIAHGLGSRPTRIWAHLVNQTAERGYSIGDRLIISPAQSSSSAVDNRGLSVVPDATNLNVRFGSSSIFVLVKNTGVGEAIDSTKWKLVIEAKV